MYKKTEKETEKETKKETHKRRQRKRQKRRQLIACLCIWEVYIQRVIIYP